MSKPRPAVLIALLLAGAGLWLALAVPFGLKSDQAAAAGICLAAIGLWATGVFPESLTALLFFALCMFTKAAPGKIVFSGFMSSAFWLVLAGIVFGGAIKSTGLGDRVAHAIGNRLGRSFNKALAGVMLMGMGLAFVMPSSMGRIVLMVPLLLALSKHLGFEQGGKGWSGLVMGGIFACFLPSFAILPANLPNMVLAGSAEALLSFPLSYADYLLRHYPVLGLLKALTLYAVLWFFYRGEEPTKSEEPPPGPMSGAEKRLLGVLAVAISLWVTDGLHHVSPAWIGLAAAILCLLPQLKILPPKSLASTNLEPTIYVAGVVGLGAVIDHAGVGQLVGGAVIDALPLAEGAGFLDFVSLSGLAALVSLATTQPGVPAVLTPFANGLAAATGMSLAAVLGTQVAGFSTLLLPYQSPPLMMGIQLSHGKAADFTRICLAMALATVAILWPLDYLWLSLIGKM